MPSGRRASSASAPSSIDTPATSDADSFPPSRGDPSRTVTRTGAPARKKAAASPAIPPPMTTTCGGVPVVIVLKTATAGGPPGPALGRIARRRRSQQRLHVEQGRNHGEVPARARARDVDAVAGNLDGADADRLGPHAEPRLVVDEHRVGGGDAEVGQGGDVDLG